MNYISQLLDAMAEHNVQAVDVRREIHDRYNAEIQAAMQGTVWLANCNNYYRHPNGKIVTQFPYSGMAFAELLKDVRLDDFHLSSVGSLI